MATTTTNLGLKKPATTDYYNIQDFNDNADILDAFAGNTITTDKLINNLASTEAGFGLDSRQGKAIGDRLTTAEGTITSHTSQLAELSKYNKIINGDFRVNQRAVSGTVTLLANKYGHDRWKAGSSGCTYTFSTSGGKTTITITTGSLIQVIEGNNLQSGNHILSWEGTAQGKIGTGSYSTSGVTSNVTGGTDLSIEFGTGTLANVKLEKGTIVTPFVSRLYAEELALCQRYYQTGGATPQGSSGIDFSGYVTSGYSYHVLIKFKVPMRSQPTMVLSNIFNQNFPTTSTVIEALTEGFIEERQSNGTGQGRFVTSFTADAEIY